MASVLGRLFSADELAALGGGAPGEVLAALREALAAGLVIEDGDRMRFRHPLVREAVDATLPRTVRQSLRRRAVDVLRQHGAPPSEVAELVMDVARAGDREAITILRRAAAETGPVSPAVASLLSRRALDLTAAGDPSRGPLTAETVCYLVYAGKAAEGVRLMAAAAGDFTDPAAEAETRLRLAHLSMQYAPADVVEQCRRALDLPGVPAGVRIHLLSFLSLGLDLFGDASAAEKTVQDAVEAARASDDHQSEVFTLIPQATRALGDGDWRLALDLAAESVPGRRTVAGATVRLWLPDAWQALICLPLGRLDEAFALIDAGMRAAKGDGLAANARVWSMLRCRALFCAGRLAEARAEAEAAIDMADEIGDGFYGYINHVARYILGRVALHTGDPDGLAEARRTAARLRQPRESPSSQRLGAWLAALLADAGPAAGAAVGPRIPVQVLDPLAAGPLPVTSPLGYADVATLTRVLLAAGRLADAASPVTRLEDFAARHRDFPFLDAAALHARALLDDDPAAALRAVALQPRRPASAGPGGAARGRRTAAAGRPRGGGGAAARDRARLLWRRGRRAGRRPGAQPAARPRRPPAGRRAAAGGGLARAHRVRVRGGQPGGAGRGEPGGGDAPLPVPVHGQLAPAARVHQARHPVPGGTGPHRDRTRPAAVSGLAYEGCAEIHTEGSGARRR